MSHDEKLLAITRKEFEGVPNVAEKEMFGSVAFMMNGKLCASVGHSRLMCRIDPSMQKELIGKKGVRPMTMKGREYKGYVYVDETVLKKEEDVAYWVGLVVAFNGKAKASKGTGR